jgi:hypothetical protein
LTPEQIKKNIDLIASSGHAATLIEKGYKNLMIESDWKLKVVYDEIEFASKKSELMT